MGQQSGDMDEDFRARGADLAERRGRREGGYSRVRGVAWGDCFFFPSGRLLYPVERKTWERGSPHWLVPYRTLLKF